MDKTKELIEKLISQYDSIEASEDSNGDLREIISEGKALIKEYGDPATTEKRRSLLSNMLYLNSFRLALAAMSEDEEKPIPESELPDRLREVGLLDAYSNWFKCLTEKGFKRKPITNTSLERGEIAFNYYGDFSVSGDHADDVFGLRATLTKDILTVSYASSRLDRFTEYRDRRGIHYEKKIRDFISENEFYISNGNNFCTVEYTPGNVTFNIIFGSMEYPSCSSAVNDLTKLAILLDKEMAKSNPFLNISEYEKKAALDPRKILHPKRISSDLGDSRSNSFRLKLSEDGIDSIIDYLLGSKFLESKKECLERAENTKSLLIAESKKHIPAVDEELCLEFEVKMHSAVNEAILAIKNMTDEDFTERKLLLFELK